MQIFSLFGEILLKDNGIEKKLESIDKKGVSTSKSIDNAFSKIGSAALKAGAAVGVGFGFKEMIEKGYKLADSASDIIEAQNVVETTFKNSGKSIEAWTDTTAKSAGIAKTNSMQWVGFMGAMLKSSGVTEESSANMSKSLVQLTGDMSSFYNVSTSDMWEKIRSGISGETEPLKQIGINMSVANLQAYALATGIKKPYAEMTQGEQTMLRYNYLMSVTKDAQGDFAKTLSTSFANQVRVAQLNIATLGQNVGTKLLPAFNSAVTWLNDNMPQIQASITNAFNAVAPVAKVTFTVIKNLFTFVKDNKEMIIAGFAAMGTIIAGLKIAGTVMEITKALDKMKTAAEGLKGMKAAGSMIESLFKMPPQAILVIGAVALIAGLATLIIQNWGPISKFFGDLWTNIGSAVSAGVATVNSLITGGLGKAIDFITSLPAKAITWGMDFIGGFIRGIENKIGDVVGAVKGVAERIKNFLYFSEPDEGPLRGYMKWSEDFMSGFAQGITDNKHLVTNAVKGLGDDLKFNMNTSLSAAVNLSGVKNQDKNTPENLNKTNNFYITVNSSEAKNTANDIRGELTRLSYMGAFK